MTSAVRSSRPFPIPAGTGGHLAPSLGVVHIITKKGKGFEHAEKAPTKFHGIPTYTQVFGETVKGLMAADSRVVAVTAAMPSGTGLDIVKAAYPEKCYDVGIAELHAVVFAAGMASRGFRPIVAIYSTFLQRAYDAVVHDVCLQNLPVIFALDRAGVVGEDGPTHHGVFDISYLRHIPNMVVMSPKDEDELHRMFVSALSYNCPVAIRYPRGKGNGIPLKYGSQDVIPAGKAEVISEPQDAVCTIMALGNMVRVALSAAGLLKSEGVSASVVNARFAKPIDIGLIEKHIACGRFIVTMEDNALAGGFGSAVLESVGHTSKVIRLGYPDAFVEQGTIKDLHATHGLTPENCVARILEEMRIVKECVEGKEIRPQNSLTCERSAG